MTLLQLTSGKTIEIDETYDQVKRKIEDALGSNKLLEMCDPDGEQVLLNPINIAYISNGKGHGPGPGAVSDAAVAAGRSRP